MDFIFTIIAVVLIGGFVIGLVAQLFRAFLSIAIILVVLIIIGAVATGGEWLFGGKEEKAKEEAPTEQPVEQVEPVQQQPVEIMEPTPVYEELTDTYSDVIEDIDLYIEGQVDTYLFMYSENNVETLHKIVHPQSDFYESQYNYMESLRNRGIELTLQNYSVLSVEQVEEGGYEVLTNETFSIYNPEKGLSEAMQQVKYFVEYVDDDYYVTDLQLL